MKRSENFLVQGLILSLTTQLALSLVADNASPRAPSVSSAASQGIVGALYRSAAIKANPEKETGVAQTARGQRCVRCGTAGYYGGNTGYADRNYDDYYYRDRAGYGGAGYYGREDQYRDPYYTARDRNWYYQPEYRNPYDRSYNRYDDRNYGREEQYYNTATRDPAYTDTRYNSNYNSYRGNGYDNLNPTYYEAMRDRFQRDRGYGYDQYYDRFYDRPGYRAQASSGGNYYDNRNFRPYDETYRGAAGFDNSGRGYYFANQQGQRPPPNREPYPPSEHYTPRDPYEQAQKPPPSHLNHYNSQPSQSQHTTPRVPPEFYNGKPAQSPQVQTVSSGAAIGVVDSNSSTNKKNSNKELDDKEKISSTYGRPSLGSSYLFDRTNEDGNSESGMSPPSAVVDEKKQDSANLEMKSE